MEVPPAMRHLPLQLILLGVGFLSAIGLQAFAFTEPASAPPVGDLPAPLNTGSTAQSKNGPLFVNTGGATIGFALPSGRAGIGTIIPNNALDIRSTLGTVYANFYTGGSSAAVGNMGNGLALQSTNKVSVYTGGAGFNNDGSAPLGTERLFVDSTGLNVTNTERVGTTFSRYLKIVGSNSPGAVTMQVANTLGVDNPDSNVPLVFQPSAGKVGIGTATPQGTLDIDNANHMATLCLNGTCVTNIDSTTNGNGAGDYLVGGSAYTPAQCTSAGGTVYNVGSGNVCQFTASSCPAGWSQYLNWSSTNAISCSSANICASGCTTNSHTFFNSARESCSYLQDLYVQSGAYGSTECFRTTCHANIALIGCI